MRPLLTASGTSLGPSTEQVVQVAFPRNRYCVYANRNSTKQLLSDRGDLGIAQHHNVCCLIAFASGIAFLSLLCFYASMSWCWQPINGESLPVVWKVLCGKQWPLIPAILSELNRCAKYALYLSWKNKHSVQFTLRIEAFACDSYHSLSPLNRTSCLKQMVQSKAFAWARQIVWMEASIWSGLYRIKPITWNQHKWRTI